MSTEAPAFDPGDIPVDVQIGIVAARFNQKLVDELVMGCQRRLKGLGVKADQIEMHRVPGAFELPLAAQHMAQTRRFDAVICLGAVVRGETPHFEYVSGECARGISAVSRKTGVPVIFGVLTTNTEQQAWDRCGGKHGHAGERAADAALEMVIVLRAITSLNWDGGDTIPF
jgi:6,7-dimethyl-8-ribityllumazine synthase